MSSNDKYRERAAEVLEQIEGEIGEFRIPADRRFALEAIATLCAQVERETLERAGIRWFSVDDRLPGAPPRLALAVERGKVRIRNTIEIHQIAEIIGVTHWAEMPPLPATHTEGK
jgi:hypothetical protein